MDIKTGEIFHEGEEGFKKALEKGDLVQVEESDMIRKQRRDRKVSLKDNRSKLGQQRIREMKKRKERNRRKRKRDKRNRFGG